MPAAPASAGTGATRCRSSSSRPWLLQARHAARHARTSVARGQAQRSHRGPARVVAGHRMLSRVTACCSVWRRSGSGRSVRIRPTTIRPAHAAPCCSLSPTLTHTLHAHSRTHAHSLSLAVSMVISRNNFIRLRELSRTSLTLSAVRGGKTIDVSFRASSRPRTRRRERPARAPLRQARARARPVARAGELRRPRARRRDHRHGEHQVCYLGEARARARVGPSPSSRASGRRRYPLDCECACSVIHPHRAASQLATSGRSCWLGRWF